MRIENKFKTRKLAAHYLEVRGWTRAGDSFGDWKFIMDGKDFCNLIVKYQKGYWEIKASEC